MFRDQIRQSTFVTEKRNETSVVRTNKSSEDNRNNDVGDHNQEN